MPALLCSNLEKMAFRSMLALAAALLLAISCVSPANGQAGLTIGEPGPVPNPKCSEQGAVCCANCGDECMLPGELGDCFRFCESNCRVEEDCIIEQEFPVIDYIVNKACDEAMSACGLATARTAATPRQITQEQCCQTMLGSCFGNAQRRFSECRDKLPRDEDGEINYGTCDAVEFQEKFNDSANSGCKESVCESKLCNPLIGNDPRCA